MKKPFFDFVVRTAWILLTVCTAGAADEKDLIAILKSQAGIVEKCDACQQLRICGTVESVEALGALLGDERIGHAARYALEAMPYPQAGQALCDAVGKTSGPVKAGLIASVGWRRDAAAIPLLVTALSDADSTVAMAAAMALGRIGGTDSEAALFHAFAASRGPRKDAVLDAILHCAEIRMKIDNDSDANVFYQKVLHAQPSSAIRLAAWRGLALSDSKRRPELVVEALTGDDEPLRLVAIRLVRETKDQRLIRAGMEKWKFLRPDAQILLVETMADQGDRTLLADILETCKSSNSSVRIAGITAVGILGDASHVAFLAERAAQSVGNEQVAARRAMAVLPGPAINSALVAALTDSTPSQRVELIKALSARRATDTASALLKMAVSDRPSVRLAALTALKDLAGPEEIIPLVDLLAADTADSANEASNALVLAARRTNSQSTAAARLLEKISSSDLKQRPLLLQTAGRLGHDSLLPVLRSALRDSNPAVMTSAIEALAAWPDAAPLPDLLRIAQTSTVRTHKILALRGSIDLIGISDIEDAQKLVQYQQAMTLADQPAERKRILAKLGQIPIPDALEWSASFLSNADLRQEAAQAVIAIARSMGLREKEKTIVALKAILHADIVADLKQQAQQILDSASVVADYILDWQISAPYTKDGMNHSQLFDQPFAPEDPSLGQAQWEPISAGTDPDRPFIVDILKRFPGDSRVGYVRTSVWSDQDRACQLWIGSDDGVKVWLNGRVVHSANVPRAITPDSDKIDVQLKSGWNLLMLKITQNNMPWELCARFRNSQGISIPTLRFDPAQFR